ncbi:MAG: DUF4395 domain-containing protein [Armatimonadota bacterium]|nr:DUF4395 domain-containing protein [Armatimonadota bacterium]MDR7500519.1 DUF4395 domain-containing protein [Armatimonadota bacterium]MDR7553883.1 DUF4395 domain-containing protein [Armatimonadota bacterium]
MTKVDHNAIKFNQVSIAVVSAAAFLADLPWLAGLLALVLAVATARPSWGLFRGIYQRLVLPLGWLRPNLVDDEPAPHRFAQGVGAAFLAAGWIALTARAAVAGWTLVLLVAVLAMVNVVFNFCAGCFVYYQLRRAGLIRRAAAQQ